MFKKITKYLGLFFASFVLIYSVILLFFPINFIQTVDHDSSLPSITLDGYTFHSETFGDPKNPVLIGIHGGPGGDYRYMRSVKELSKDYFIVLYDQRMTGLSSRKSDVDISLKSYFDDLNAIVDLYSKNKPVYLVGHSWGAMMASGYIGMYPDKVRKVILIEPGILRADLADEFFNQPPPEFTLSDYLEISKTWLNKWRVKTSVDVHARNDYFMSTISLYFANKARKNTEFKGWRMGTYSMDQTLGRLEREPIFLDSLNFIDDAMKFNGEVLFLTSENNNVYGKNYQEKFLKFYKNAKQWIVKSAGHSIFIDQPEVSNQMIHMFLSE